MPIQHESRTQWNFIPIGIQYIAASLLVIIFLESTALYIAFIILLLSMSTTIFVAGKKAGREQLQVEQFYQQYFSMLQKNIYSWYNLEIEVPRYPYQWFQELEQNTATI